MGLVVFWRLGAPPVGAGAKGSAGGACDCPRAEWTPVATAPMNTANTRARLNMDSTFASARAEDREHERHEGTRSSAETRSELSLRGPRVSCRARERGA